MWSSETVYLNQDVDSEMHQLNMRINILIYQQVFKIKFMTCFVMVSGICLYLDKARSEVDSYDCKVFKYGCPTGPYFGSTVYKCKNSISYQIPVEDCQRNEFFLFRLIVNYKKNKGDKKVITKGLFEKFYVSVFGSEPNLYHSLIISLPAKRRHV